MSANVTAIFVKPLEEKKPDGDFEKKASQDEEHSLRVGKTWCRKVPVTPTLLLLLLCTGLVVVVVFLQRQGSEIRALKDGLENQESEISDLRRLLNNSGDQAQDIIIVEDYANVSELFNISELVAKISQLSQEIRRLDSLNSTQLSQVQKVFDQGQMLLSIASQLIDLENSRNSTTRNIVRLEQDLRNTYSLLSFRLNETHQQLDVLSSLLGSVSQSHGNHEVQISEIQRNITAIVSKQVQADNQLTSLESGHQSQSRKISSLQSDTSQLTNQLTDTKRQVTDNKRKISEADGRISSLQTDNSLAQIDRGGIKQRVSKLEYFHSGTATVSTAYTYYFIILAVSVCQRVFLV